MITRNDLPVTVPPTDPPLLSDHAFVTADFDCTAYETVSTEWQTVRSWRLLDINALTADLCNSPLVQSPSDDVNKLLKCYDMTLRSLVDKHVPLRT